MGEEYSEEFFGEVEELLENDEISVEEEGFMLGEYMDSEMGGDESE